MSESRRWVCRIASKVSHQLWKDQAGAVVSAELVLLATLGVVGAVVGLKAASRALNDELLDLACAIRSLDQSYCYSGFSTCGAWSAGSRFVQEPVEKSVAELRQWADQQQQRQEQEEESADVAPDQKAARVERHPVRFGPERRFNPEKGRRVRSIERHGRPASRPRSR